MLTYLPVELVVSKMTAGASDVFRLEDYGTLAPGQPADITVITPSEQYAISESDILSPCGWSPFTGRTVAHRTKAYVAKGATRH